jgi:formate hydrogenlyase subunit 6/NADH:ubiquinone oxidoreductase subunit I
MQQPIFDFVRGYCEFECNLCTQICPTGALTPLDLLVKKRSRIGIAHFFKRHCVVYSEGNECGACIEHCPTIAVTGKPFGPINPTSCCLRSTRICVSDVAFVSMHARSVLAQFAWRV